MVQLRLRLLLLQPRKVQVCMDVRFLFVGLKGQGTESEWERLAAAKARFKVECIHTIS